ncbi:MAG: diacylglycerol kinase family protein [Ilumatobacteraceae bacterium]
MSATFRVFLNETAGSATGDEQLADIVAAFADAGAEASAEHIPPDELGAGMRAAAERGETVVVAGGDGTINTAAAVAVNDGITLGVLPLGTFNHFAKDLGVPTELAEAAEFLVAAVPTAVDVGEVNERVFVNNASIGVYPRMVDERDELRTTRGWGKIRATLLAGWSTLRNPPRDRLRVALDGRPAELHETSLLFVGNGLYDDGGRDVGTRTSLSAGVLGVYEIEAASRWRLLTEAVRTKLRGLHAADHTHRWSVAELRIDADERRLAIALDGEPTEMEPPLRFACRPGALTVLGAPTTEDVPVSQS